MKRMSLGLLLAAAVAAGPAAHHSYSAYDNDLVVQIEGVLEAAQMVNPHSLLTVRTPEAAYTLEWLAPATLVRRGVEKDALKIGDRVIATGNPHKDLATNGVVRVKTLRRPADGWAWPR